MSAHTKGCKWSDKRGCYVRMGKGCADPEAHRKWRHPTWCAACGKPIIWREEVHRCAPDRAPGDDAP